MKTKCNSVIKIKLKNNKLLNLYKKSRENKEKIRNKRSITQSNYTSKLTTSSFIDRKIKTYSAFISNYNSVKEVEKILEEFNKNNNYIQKKRGKLINLGNNILKVEFNNQIYLNEFISCLSFIKYENPNFNFLKITKNNINLKKRKEFPNNSLPSIYNYNKMNRYKNNNYLSQRIINLKSKPKLKLRDKIYDVILALKNNTINHDMYYHGLSVDENDEDEIFNNYYKEQRYVRNSSPYMTEYEKQVLKAKKSKKFFIGKKDFITSFGKYSIRPNFIANYVRLTPGENPLTHEFRKIDRSKWIDKNGFNL